MKIDKYEKIYKILIKYVKKTKKKNLFLLLTNVIFSRIMVQQGVYLLNLKRNQVRCLSCPSNRNMDENQLCHCN